LFDADTGELLAINNNGGASFTGGTFYGFSQLLVPIHADREVALAVSAFPDLAFTGSPAGGRYLLTVNAYPGDALTQLNDDDAREVPIGFGFPFEGSTWNSVFVNTNGHLTFGAADALDFTESVSEFLNGPPRIAGLWRDLSPFHGARILIEHG